jgi:hypothetical protein
MEGERRGGIIRSIRCFLFDVNLWCYIIGLRKRAVFCGWGCE